MSDTDFGVAYKLTRATHHSKTLNKRIDRFLKSKAIGVANDFNGEYLVVTAFSRRPPPPTCGALIGEILYHQRASLDYMACELARRNGQLVDDLVEFPIFTDPDAFRNPVSGNLTPAIKKRIGLLRLDHQAIIEDEQPFQGRHGPPEDDPLAILYSLSNFDRHQFIHLTTVITNASFHNFTPPEASARLKQVSVTYGAFESEAEVARFRLLPGPEIDVQVESEVRFDVAFSKEGPGAGRPVRRTLGDIGVRVVEIIGRLDRTR